MLHEGTNLVDIPLGVLEFLGIGHEQKEIFGVIPVSPISSLLSPGHSCCRVGSHRKSRDSAEAETATGPWLDVL